MASDNQIKEIKVGSTNYKIDAETVKGVDVISTKEDKSNKITSFSGSETNEQYPGALLVATTLNAIAELAEGKTKNYVISDATTGTNIVNTSFNSINNSIEITFANKSIKDVKNNTVSLADLKIGDIVSITETNVPDRWVGSITSTTITFYKLETKLDIDASPTSGSSNPVSSGGVYTALTNVAYKNDVNTFTDNQAIQGNLDVSGTVDATTISGDYYELNGTEITTETWTFTVENNGVTSTVTKTILLLDN